MRPVRRTRAWLGQVDLMPPGAEPLTQELRAGAHHLRQDGAQAPLKQMGRLPGARAKRAAGRADDRPGGAPKAREAARPQEERSDETERDRLTGLHPDLDGALRGRAL